MTFGSGAAAHAALGLDDLRRTHGEPQTPKPNTQTPTPKLHPQTNRSGVNTPPPAASAQRQRDLWEACSCFTWANPQHIKCTFCSCAPKLHIAIPRVLLRNTQSYNCIRFAFLQELKASFEPCLRHHECGPKPKTQNPNPTTQTLILSQCVLCTARASSRAPGRGERRGAGNGFCGERAQLRGRAGGHDC